MHFVFGRLTVLCVIISVSPVKYIMTIPPQTPPNPPNIQKDSPAVQDLEYRSGLGTPRVYPSHAECNYHPLTFVNTFPWDTQLQLGWILSVVCFPSSTFVSSFENGCNTFTANSRGGNRWFHIRRVHTLTLLNVLMVMVPAEWRLKLFARVPVISYVWIKHGALEHTRAFPVRRQCENTESPSYTVRN